MLQKLLTAAHVAAVIAVISAAIPIVQIRELGRALTARVERKRQLSYPPGRVVRYADTLFRALDKLPLYDSTCLKRSLVLYYLLRRIGFNVDVQIGISKDGKDVAGHSWLTLSGEPFSEGEDVARYAVVLSIP